MKILALEFSSEHRSVAITSGDGGWVICRPDENSRTSQPLQWIESALKKAGMEREEIECIAVGTGPGSYTGIRTAIAIAQGWQLARPVKLLGISSVECLAASAHHQEWHGRINIVIDAQRNEFYLGWYEIDSAGYREFAPLRLATFAEVKALSETGEIVVGPEIKKVFPAARDHFPSAGTLGLLAGERSDFVTGNALTPVYLRETAFVKAAPLRALPVD